MGMSLLAKSTEGKFLSTRKTAEVIVKNDSKALIVSKRATSDTAWFPIKFLSNIFINFTVFLVEEGKEVNFFKPCVICFIPEVFSEPVSCAVLLKELVLSFGRCIVQSGIYLNDVAFNSLKRSISNIVKVVKNFSTDVCGNTSVSSKCVYNSKTLSKRVIDKKCSS